VALGSWNECYWPGLSDGTPSAVTDGGGGVGVRYPRVPSGADAEFMWISAALVQI
jgi:hypothetical protein